MTWLVAMAVFLLSVSSQACDNTPSSTSEEHFYAAVKAEDAMSLKFTLILSTAAKKNKSVKVFGGGEFGYDRLPSCQERAVPVPMEWKSQNVGHHWTFSNSYFSSIYRICVYDQKGQTLYYRDVCNSEVGD